MPRLISSFVFSLINFVIPPRGREAVVLTLTPEKLFSLRHHDGLPYHEKEITALVWELKYNANAQALSLAGEFLSEELLGVAEDEFGKPLLLPIPMHPERRRLRGYNQTELLCEAALKHLGDAYEYAPDILERLYNTAPQQTLARNKRLKNLKNSMIVKNTAKIKGRVCVVVDDVMTTGATLEEARRALKTAGARAVYPIALAKS